MRRDTFGIIFSNMGDPLVREMTRDRCMAAIPFGGRYRLIDFVLSNMVRAGMPRVGIITTTNYRSLMDHLGSGKPWDMARKTDGIVIFPPYITNGLVSQYNRVTELDGVLKYLELAEQEYIFLTDADVVCNRLDIDALARFHMEKNADITLVYKRCPLPHNLGQRMTLRYSESGRVNEILMSPQAPGEYNVGLNMVFMHKSVLVRLIRDAVSRSYTHFGRDILQQNLSDLRVFAWELPGFSAVIDGMAGYLAANMALLRREVRQDLFAPDRPIYTKVMDEMPTKYGLGSSVHGCMIADGCLIDGQVERSVLSRGVRVEKGAEVSDCVVMQGAVIGEGARLAHVVVDKDVTVQAGQVMMGTATCPAYIPKGTTV